MRKMLLITSKPGKHRLWRVSKWWDYAQYVQYKESPEKKKYTQQLSNFYRIIKEEFQDLKERLKYWVSYFLFAIEKKYRKKT